MHRSVLLLFVAIFCACGGEVAISPQESAGTSSGGGGSGSGGAGGSAGGPDAGCVPQPQDPIPPETPGCADLGGLVLTEAIVTDESGDGVFSPGETATITTNLVDTTGHGFSWYPAVTFESDSPAVGVTSDAQFYAILPCQELEAKALAKIADDAPNGTTVTITARVSMLNNDCKDTFQIEAPIHIQ